MANVGTKRKKSESVREIIGEIIYYRRFRSHFLELERDILVWLPPSYQKSKSKRYPVLYMHDGQNIFDPSTSFSGKDWRVDENVTELIINGEIEEIIIIGINNTHNRLHEYSDSQTGHNYMKFIVEELKSFVDTYFRTLPDRNNTAVMGSSMGGLISLLLIWNYPNIFSKAGCLSSSFWYNNASIFKTIRDGEKKNIILYLDSGEDGKKDAQNMFCVLTNKGYTLGDDFDYYFDRGAGHTEPAWANRLKRPLRYFFGKK